jgi:hypothetical protein
LKQILSQDTSDFSVDILGKNYGCFFPHVNSAMLFAKKQNKATNDYKSIYDAPKHYS